MSLKIVRPVWFINRNRFSTNIISNKDCQILARPLIMKKDAPPSNTTVDLDDVQQHAKQMKEWWDVNGSMKALHTYNLIRVPFVRDGLAEQPINARTLTPLEGKTILDVGCGGGIFSVPLAKLGAKVTGIDASRELIEMAKEHVTTVPQLKHNMPNYICTTMEEHAESNEEQYDAVVASEIIEHVNNKELFVRSCVRALKPGGRLFFTTPNRTKLSEICVIFLAENVFQSIPKGTHQIDKFITPTELTFLLERNNCHVEIIHGIFYNVITHKWSWSKYQPFVYALQAVKLHENDSKKVQK